MVGNSNLHPKREWHVDRTVSIGHIITTLTVAISAVVWAMKMDTRVTVLENERVHASKAEEHLARDISELKLCMLRIEGKLEARLDGKADKEFKK